MTVALLVSLAAAAGAVARYLVDLLVSSRHDSAFPWGTLVINVSGSLLLGVVTGLALRHGLPRVPTLVLSSGFVGGYTTWSTWTWETLLLVQDGARLAAALNVAVSLAAGLLAVWLGLALT